MVKTKNITITPESHLTVLSKNEVLKLLDSGQGGLYHLFRRCVLAVLNCGSHLDDLSTIEIAYCDFDVSLVMTERNFKLELRNAPADAFVDDQLIKGISEHIFAVVRDILYVNNEIIRRPHDLQTKSGSITDFIFQILRNAELFKLNKPPKLVVFWGGHAIPHDEYSYSKQVGYQVGLRELDICTGCGPGAMKGPMQGATIGHAKQRYQYGRYLGITEPSIIESEPPNPIVNELVILPDIEKRLESFVRTGHAICIFPGGVGTMEELLYILCILMMEENKDSSAPVILTGPESSSEYFKAINSFLINVLGENVVKHYTIIINEAEEVATFLEKSVKKTKQKRKKTGDAFYFNWKLSIPFSLQQPFEANHQNIKKINLSYDLPPFELVINLRKIFSAIVAGNVKKPAIEKINQYGPFEIFGDNDILKEIDQLLKLFIKQGRMKINTESYNPCYKIL